MVIMGNLKSPNFLFLKLNNHISKIAKIAFNAYFDRYFETSKHTKESKITSLQNKILIFTEANKQLKDKIIPKVSCPSAPALSRSSLSTPLSHVLPLELPLPLNQPTTSSSELISIYTFKIKLLKIKRKNP